MLSPAVIQETLMSRCRSSRWSFTFLHCNIYGCDVFYSWVYLLEHIAQDHSSCFNDYSIGSGAQSMKSTLVTLICLQLHALSLPSLSSH